MKGRNGKIELLRFVFSVIVVIFHINMDVWSLKKNFSDTLSLFWRGNFGVEFFFLVSGFLMASAVERQLERERLDPRCAPASLGDGTLQFLWRKVKALLPYHLFCYGLFLILWLSQKPTDMPYSLFQRLPGLFFLDRTGIYGTSALGVEWYISSMLLAMAILYPLCKCYYRTFSRLIAPLTGILLVGYMSATVGHLSDANLWNGLTFHCNLRAVAEICLGVTCYEICKGMQKREYTPFQRGLLTFGEAAGYLLVIRFCCSRMPSKYEAYVLAVLCIAVTITFSCKGYLGESRIFNNKVCYFLGAVSLPVYLIQNVSRYFVRHWLGFLRPRNQGILILTLTVLGGTLLYLAWSGWTKRKQIRTSAV